MAKPIYHIDDQWRDPFEAPPEQRRADRIRAEFRVTMTVRIPELHGRFVGPALVRDISLTGMQVITKHELEPSQEVSVTIDTDFLERAAAYDSFVMPQQFVTRCRVVHAESAGARRKRVGLEFADAVADNMDFALFVRHVESPAIGALAS